MNKQNLRAECCQNYTYPLNPRKYGAALSIIGWIQELFEILIRTMKMIQNICTKNCMVLIDQCLNACKNYTKINSYQNNENDAKHMHKKLQEVKSCVVVNIQAIFSTI